MKITTKEGKEVYIPLDEREYKMLLFSLQYSEDAFGAPNDLLMKLVAKLWKYIETFHR